jgi:hypothetical protein
MTALNFDLRLTTHDGASILDCYKQAIVISFQLKTTVSFSHNGINCIVYPYTSLLDVQDLCEQYFTKLRVLHEQQIMLEQQGWAFPSEEEIAKALKESSCPTPTS